MEKKTLYALVALVALGIGAVFAMRAPEKGERKGPPPRPIAAFKASDVASLEILTEKQEKTVLTKSGDKWRITAPGDWPADAAGVKSLLDGLERLAFGDIVTETTDKHAELGVADGKAQRVTVKDQKGTVLADFLVGKSVSGFSMIRPVGKNAVWQATGFFPYMASREPKAWRDHLIVEFGSGDADKLTVEGGGAKLTVEKTADKTDKGQPKWKVDEATGDAPKTAEALDLEQVNGSVQALSALRAADFADDKKPEQVGLANAGVTLTVTAKGKTYTLLVGNASGEDVFVKTSDAPQIYTVKKFSLEQLTHKPIDYRDKQLVKAAENDLNAVEVSYAGQTVALDRAGDKWKARGITADDGKVKLLVGAFENLQGSGFSDEKDPVKTGLKKPAAMVTLHLKNKSTVTLKVGSLTKDQADYYMQKGGSPDVMLVKKFAVDRFLKKPADLTTASANASGPPKKK